MNLLSDIPHSSNSEPSVSLPKIIFGTSALGNLYTELPENTKTQIVSECLRLAKHPVVFDSAGKYGAGLALEMLGKILENLNTKPENILISNKLGWFQTPLTTTEPTFEKDVWKGLKNDAVQRISYNGIIECFEQGNQLLGTKYTPQLLSVHDPDEYLASAKTSAEYDKFFLDIIDAYRALADMKKLGKAKYIGVGAKNWKVIKAISQHVALDWVMFANSMTIMNHPEELLGFMKELQSKRITIVNSAVFQAGFLLGGNYYDYKLLEPNTPENRTLFNWRETFHTTCYQYGISPMVACVNFALNVPGVSSIALNTSNPAHVKINIEAIQQPVPPEFYNEMKTKGLISKNCSFI